MGKPNKQDFGKSESNRCCLCVGAQNLRSKIAIIATWQEIQTPKT